MLKLIMCLIFQVHTVVVILNNTQLAKFSKTFLQNNLKLKITAKFTDFQTFITNFQKITAK